MKHERIFESIKLSFIDDLWKTYPGWASNVGYHKYDAVLQIPDEKSRLEELKFATNYIQKLNSVDSELLSPGNKTDYLLIRDYLKYTEWNLLEFKSFEWNPSTYNVAGGFARLLNGRFAPLDSRLRSISEKLINVPDYYVAAKKNIRNATLEHCDLAIKQNQNGIEVFRSALTDSIQKSTLSPNEKEVLLKRSAVAANAIEEYSDWLQNELRPGLNQDKARSFRIGKDLFEKKFHHTIQSAYTGAQIYQKAIDRKQVLHANMADLSRKLWPKYFGNQPMPDADLILIKRVIDTISVKHVHRDSFMLAIEKQIPQLDEFVRKKDLLYVDPGKPLVVRRTPGYMEGIAGASISAPGPYDKNENTYYNVSPLDGYSPEAAESYLREYNHYILQILNIHEAIPGHYTQLVYSNNAPSIIKSILGNGTMMEGWAVYTELMMLEEGYGDNEPEMWLMYYKWHLRSVCNTILDYGVHVLNMDEAAAYDLLVNQAFQQDAEAKGKWRRVTLTSVQLCSYFTGFTEIFELRENQKKYLGDKFKLKNFHEKFLSFGSAPVKYIDILMRLP